MSDGDDAATGISVAGHFSVLNWTLVFTRLTVEVDGEPHRGRWRRRFIPTTPGEHRVDVSFGYVGIPYAGEASVVVRVPEGRVVRLAYRAPGVPTGTGRLVGRSPDPT